MTTYKTKSESVALAKWTKRAEKWLKTYFDQRHFCFSRRTQVDWLSVLHCVCENEFPFGDNKAYSLAWSWHTFSALWCVWSDTQAFRSLLMLFSARIELKPCKPCYFKNNLKQNTLKHNQVLNICFQKYISGPVLWDLSWSLYLPAHFSMFGAFCLLMFTSFRQRILLFHFRFSLLYQKEVLKIFSRHTILS